MLLGIVGELSWNFIDRIGNGKALIGISTD